MDANQVDTGIRIGDTIAGRRIEGFIGRGGMGVVYLARYERLDRLEALKVIADERANNPNFRERFLREVRIAADLEHPHVIPVYDAAEASGGRLFMTMRYVEDGKTLATLIQERGRLEPSLAAHLISDVASAIDAAHARGLIHRDVKPANILIAGEQADHPYLTDFGLSKQTMSDSTLGGTGYLVGTIDYLSPEQTQGRMVDFRADVYALGVTLFEALTGRVPYLGDTDSARLVAKVNESPPMVSQVAPGIPSAFDAVLARALASDPDERYQSAGELGRAARSAAGYPSEIRPPTKIGVGTVLADCLIEEVAGEGGMAVVYRATQQSLGKTVALKVMASELADDPAFRVRFEREWKIAASIDHPNVIPIYWAGEAGGRLYIVMRYVGGGTLRETVVSHGRFDPLLAVEVLEQVASALDAAHERGLVHRDVKPGNVLIEPSGKVYLTDFGLAKAVGESDTDGQVLGTSRYVAPERHRAEHIDEVAADIYSLGCLFWDLLGGAERESLNTVDGVPEALAQVVARATDLDPGQRFSSAGELAQAAHQALDQNVDAGAERPRRANSRTTAPLVDQRRQPLEPTPLSSGLVERVLGLCDSVIGVLDADNEAYADVDAVRQSLTAPLRIAVIGGKGTGTATLIRALLGRRLNHSNDLNGLGVKVTFTYGAREHLHGVRNDGSEFEHGMDPDGTLPQMSRSAPNGLHTLTVVLPVDALRGLSLTYIPAGEEASIQTGEADAFVVALPASGVDEFLEAPPRFIGLSGGSPISAINAVLVMTKADLVAGAEREMAAEVKAALGPTVAAVIPFMGLVAETANAGLVANDDVALIAELAGLGAKRRGALRSSKAFLAADELGAQPERRRLLEHYGLFGLDRAVELADADQLSGANLRRRLREVSGIEAIDAQLDGLHQRADALKADQALKRLDEISYRWPELAFVRDQVEALSLQPDMHVVDLMRTFERCVFDELEIPNDLLGQLERLITAQTTAQRLGLDHDADEDAIRSAAMAGFRSWKTLENASHAPPAVARAARAVARSYELFARRARQTVSEGA
jgi:serine/threonine protein kinase